MLTVDGLLVLDAVVKRLLLEAKANLADVPASITGRPGADKLRLQYAKTRARFSNHVLSSVHSLGTGRISRREFNRRMYGFFSYYYTAAVELGKELEGGLVRLSQEDQVWVDNEVDEEYKYSLNFANDIVIKAGTMDYQKRAQMYVDGLDAVFIKGMTLGLSEEDMLISWNLSPVENCPECLEWAAGGPYTVDSLPAYPGDGSSSCLSNCKCWLSSE